VRDMREDVAAFLIPHQEERTLIISTG